MSWNNIKPLKTERINFRVTEETAWRIRMLAKNMRISRTVLIENLVDDAWEDHTHLDVVLTMEEPEYSD